MVDKSRDNFLFREMRAENARETVRSAKHYEITFKSVIDFYFLVFWWLKMNGHGHAPAVVQLVTCFANVNTIVTLIAWSDRRRVSVACGCGYVILNGSLMTIESMTGEILSGIESANDFCLLPHCERECRRLHAHVK